MIFRYQKYKENVGTIQNEITWDNLNTTDHLTKEPPRDLPYTNLD